MRVTTLRRLVMGTALLLVAPLLGCSSGTNGSGGNAGSNGGSGGGAGGGGGNGGTFEPAPYNGMTWDVQSVEVEAGKLAGTQGRLLVAADGTLQYAYYKSYASEPDCDIAAFSSSPAAPGVHYELKVATKASGAAWSIAAVPIDQVAGANNAYVSTLFGLDGVLEETSGDLLLVFAGGGTGLSSCGSSDLVLARRPSGGAWSFQTLADDSNAYTGSCPDAACTSGTDVGAWATIAESPTGDLAVPYIDFHNFWDEDGQSFQGYEMWDEVDGIVGIEPWSGRGRIGDAVFAADGTLTVAYTGFASTGLRVAQRLGTTGEPSDWLVQDLLPNATLGERISIARAPNGHLGIAVFHDKQSNVDVDDLRFCESEDDGENWLDCENVGVEVLQAGFYPSLVFDAASRPLISYRACGTLSCENNTDGARLAWRELNGVWRFSDIHFNNATKSGLYTSIVLDPDTGAPIVAFQDQTLGAALVATGLLP